MSKKIDVIYEDNHLIAVNKRAGDLSQKDQTNDESLIEMIKAYIKVKYNKPGDVFLGSIHRLDRPTSGAIIYARTSKGLSRMTKLFKDRQVDKTYVTIVNRRPPSHVGTLSNYLIKDSKKNKSKVVSKSKTGSKLAELDYEVLREVENNYLLKVKLHTGRHHQIRAQFANIKSHIVGDLKYGFATPNDDKSICLHCSELKFTHPVTKEKIRITAAYPKIPIWKKMI